MAEQGEEDVLVSPPARQVSFSTIQSCVLCKQADTVHTALAAPSGPPLSLRITAVTARSLTLDWDLPLLRDRNGPVINYGVNLTALEVPSVQILAISRNRISIAGLHPYYTYSCKVQAKTSVGSGPYSTSVNVTTLQDG